MGELEKKQVDAATQNTVKNLIEFHRTVHAEMDALLSCARNGIVTKGAVIYTTTFPCHNCAKHIIAAGISKIVYLEAYQKSLAFDLHSDALVASSQTEIAGLVPIVRFNGIGPRRFLDLFSQSLAAVPKEKKRDGNGYLMVFDAGSKGPRYMMQFTRASEGENLAGDVLHGLNWFIQTAGDISAYLNAG